MSGDLETLLDDVSGHLSIELSLPPEQIFENLSSQKAPSEARIVSVAFEAGTFKDGELRALTNAELDQVVLVQTEVLLRSCRSEIIIRFNAPNGVHFTVRDLLAAVEETERVTRHSNEWFDGIDIHHVFFEGLRREADGVWSIDWGS